MAITPLTVYGGQVPQIGQSQATFDTNNSNMFAYFGTFGDDFNARINDINTAVSTTNTNVTTTITNLSISASYLEQTRQAKDESLGAVIACNLAYSNTSLLIEDLDITGTGGYTIDAVDAMNEDEDLEKFINFKI